ncbi:uncharacterized protein LOC131888202 [Tigriopus californicus]|uniref:uncharacterized protein LOC131888202 n=1 Tax=Tigriopus californicus TaxID=6832 RepID=UPI0027DA3E20|nr:uncharacterized protein LOC131888202 [Tigriopus californicus]
MKHEEQRDDETKMKSEEPPQPSPPLPLLSSSSSSPQPPTRAQPSNLEAITVWPRDFTLLKAHSKQIASKWWKARKCGSCSWRWCNKSTKESIWGEQQNDRDMKFQNQRKMIKYAWLLVVFFLLLIVLKEYFVLQPLPSHGSSNFQDGKRTIIVIEEPSTNKFQGDQVDYSLYPKARVAALVKEESEEVQPSQSDSISVDNVPVPSDYRYDPAEAFERRRNIMNYVCDQYSDPLQPEFIVVQNFTHLEDRRSFLLNHGLSYCLNDFSASDLLGSLFLQIVEEKADSETNTMDPCSKQEFDEAVGNNYVSNKKNGYSDSTWSTPCNLLYAMDQLPFKVVAVQHPLEKLVFVFNDIVKKQGETFEELTRQIQDRYGLELTFKTFMVYLIKGSLDFGDAVVYPEEFMPYWSVCNTCAHPYRPSIILKYEHLGNDLLEMFRILGFSEYVKDMPNGLSTTNTEEVSDEAMKYYKQLPKSLISDIYQLYRADHEIFGYDPRPYVDLGYE